LLNAIDAGDVLSLRTAADALELFKKQSSEASSLRSNIIAMKGVLDDCSQSMTVPVLAELLGIQGGADGFRGLRTLCKKLHFPIAEAKRGPRKVN
jgi:hypothetical protein